MQKLNEQGPRGDVPVPENFPDLVIIPIKELFGPPADSEEGKELLRLWREYQESSLPVILANYSQQYQPPPAPDHVVESKESPG